MRLSLFKLLVLLLGVLLISQSFVQRARAEEDEDDYDDGDLGEDEKEEPSESAADSLDEKDVVVLTTGNFEKIALSAKYALVEFYAPWCGHCKKLAPEYAKAATEIKALDSSIVIAKVDATAENELAEKYKVEGFPTIKWFVDGKASEYNGGRTADTIVQWIKKKTGPPATKVTTKAELEKAEGTSNAVVVGYFSKLEGSDYEAFVSAARTIDDAEFLETTSSDVAKAAGITGSAPALSIVKNWDVEERNVEVYKGAFSSDSLVTFINTYMTPLMMPFNEKYQGLIFGKDVPYHIFYVGDKKALEDEANLKVVTPVAKSLRGKATLVKIDVEDSEASRVLDFFGLDGHKEGVVFMGFNMEAGKKYRYRDAVNEKAFKKWAEKVVAGEAEVEYKSEEVPADGEDKDGEVQVVVGKTVESIVLDPTKDVLLEVYAPWCGHCKQLAPIYKKLAKRFSVVDSVVIAKMDGTTNEHASVAVEGFPTLLFYPADKNAEVIPFDSGDRTLKSLTKFIKQHAKVAYELPKKTKEAEDEDDKSEL